MRRAWLVLAPALALASGCCGIDVRVPPHAWSVLVTPKAGALDRATIAPSGELDRLTCAAVCPVPTMSPGGAIHAHLASCEVARLAGQPVVVCNGDTEGSCVERSWSSCDPPVRAE
jgi:hypothetical protein